MCIGPLAPKALAQTAAPAPPPAPPKPVAVPQNIVQPTAAADRTKARGRTTLSGGVGANRTILSGSLVSLPGSGGTV